MDGVVREFTVWALIMSLYHCLSLWLTIYTVCLGKKLSNHNYMCTNVYLKMICIINYIIFFSKVFNLHINGVFHCAVRYRHLHDFQMQVSVWSLCQYYILLQLNVIYLYVWMCVLVCLCVCLCVVCVRVWVCLHVYCVMSR